MSDFYKSDVGFLKSDVGWHLKASVGKQLREIEVHMVSAISFGWFADFGKTLTIIQRSSQPVYSDKW